MCSVSHTLSKINNYNLNLSNDLCVQYIVAFFIIIYIRIDEDGIDKSGLREQEKEAESLQDLVASLFGQDQRLREDQGCYTTNLA